MTIFTDEVIEQMKQDIASHAPERGGALLGARGSNLVSRFLFDPQAKTTAASYFPSDELIEKVEQAERTTGLTFKGIVHSHPNGMDRPSQADLHAFACNLAANPRLGSFIAPIISRGVAKEKHEIDLGSKSKLSCFEAFRPRPENLHSELAECEKDWAYVMAIGEALGFLEIALKEQFAVPFKTISNLRGPTDSEGYQNRRIKCRLFQLDIFIPDSYPVAPPITLYSPRVKGKQLDVQDLKIPWGGLSCHAPKALADQVISALIETGAGDQSAIIAN